VPRGELAVIWDLAAAINAGSRAGIIVLELRQRHEIQVRMTGSEAG
jgi:phosphotransferase system HPr-like phosphotransfer protein